MRSGAIQIIDRLRQAGHQALLAGGCVRDLLLGREPVDWDVATDAIPAQVQALFPRTVPIGVKFGIVLVRAGDGEYQVARFRRDGNYRHGRWPDTVDFVGAEEDARRRDFTINGMFFDPDSDSVIDYVGGRTDLECGVLRAIGDPNKRFTEDYLRLLRAVRFAARLDFAIEPQTWAAMQAAAPGIVQISPERIRDELTRMLTQGSASQAMELMQRSGLMRQVLPEVADLEGVMQPPEFHPEGDVWTHVKLLLDRLQGDSVTLAWGALLHDIGKPPTYAVRDRIRFDRHDVVGAGMAEDVCRRLRMSTEDTDKIVQMTAEHMRFRDVRNMRPARRQRFMRLRSFPELLELHRLDCLASHGHLDLYDFCREQLSTKDADKWCTSRLVNGHDLIAMGYSPGVLFKRILNAVEDEQLEGRIGTATEAQAFVRRRFGAELQNNL